MKKATVQISYDSSKLAAIRQYMGKRDAQLEPELADALQKIYEIFFSSLPLYSLHY